MEDRERGVVPAARALGRKPHSAPEQHAPAAQTRASTLALPRPSVAPMPRRSIGAAAFATAPRLAPTLPPNAGNTAASVAPRAQDGTAQLRAAEHDGPHPLWETVSAPSRRSAMLQGAAVLVLAASIVGALALRNLAGEEGSQSTLMGTQRSGDSSGPAAGTRGESPSSGADLNGPSGTFGTSGSTTGAPSGAQGGESRRDGVIPGSNADDLAAAPGGAPAQQGQGSGEGPARDASTGGNSAGTDPAPASPPVGGVVPVDTPRHPDEALPGEEERPEPTRPGKRPEHAGKPSPTSEPSDPPADDLRVKIKSGGGVTDVEVDGPVRIEITVPHLPRWADRLDSG